MTSGAMSGDFARRVVERVNETVKGQGQRLAEQWGNPLDGQKPTKEQQVRLWNLRNPQADPMQVQQLIDSGQHSQALDMVYPWRNALIGKGDLQTRIKRAQQLADMAGQSDAASAP